MTPELPFALVIGAGPAGLMAADRLLTAGHRVVLAEAKPSPARKFLMAGKSGLNLTKDEPLAAFLTAFAEAEPWLTPALTAFGPAQVAQWAEDLGQPVFTGSSGRVFPKAMKASPLLRAWLARLGAAGLDLRPRWRWIGLENGVFLFDTPTGPQSLRPSATVLALGGASWPRLGSDGVWAPILAAQGVALAPFQPANMGFGVAWSAHMTPHFGAPLKSIALIAGPQHIRAEAVLTARGIEGGGIYAISRTLRDGAPLSIDLFPDLDAQTLAARLSNRPKGESATNTLRKALSLSGARLALVQECVRPLPADAGSRAKILKSIPIPITNPHPMAEAISTAGGIRQDAVTDDLMLRALPGVFAAGEMLDWEAPTGGYLLTASLATGRQAGEAAARWLQDHTGQNEPAPA
ncbi:MAG: TIGR03862 family flavoprotein [Rhodobacteraceae bacterium]|nr:TIGR03862 family flavoprotein [Paracoccaceae bacterium]